MQASRLIYYPDSILFDLARVNDSCTLCNARSRPLSYFTADIVFARYFALFTHNVRWQSGAGDQVVVALDMSHLRPYALIRSEKTTMKPKKNREQSTSKIKAAALHLVATKGYSNTSLEEIANAAGFTKGAVYYHFKSKKRLILEILHDIEFRSIELLDTGTVCGGWIRKRPADPVR